MFNLGSAFGKIILDIRGAMANLREFKQGLGTLRSAMASTSAAMRSVGASLTTQLTLPIAGVATAMAKTASDFESQMNVLSVAARGGTTSLDDLRKASIAVGADTELVGVSASESAEAMTNLYKAGLDTTQIFGDLTGYIEGATDLSGALRASVDLAAASELDLARASETVVIAMSSFGLEAEDVSRIANAFVQSADASVASVGGLADALVNVGPTASSFGLSLEETTTALAILSERGINGAEAGTNLKSMFNNLIRPTDDVQATLETLNVQLYDTEGNMRSLPDILADLRQGLYDTVEATTMVGGRTEEQNKQLALAEKGYEQASNAIYKHQAGLKILSDEQLYKYTRQQAAANKEIARLGAITGEAVTSTRTLTQAERDLAIQTLAGSYGKNAMIALLDQGNDAWTEMTQKVNNAATVEESAAARTKGFAAAMEQLQGTIESLMITAGTPLIQNFLTPLAQKITDVLGGVTEDLNPGLIQAGIIFGGVAAAIGPVLVALGAIMSPIGLVAMAIGGLAAAWHNNFLGLQDTTKETWGIIQPILMDVWGWLSVNVPAALSVMRVGVETVLGIVRGLWGEHGGQVTETLKLVWGWLAEKIPAALTTMWSTVQTVLSTVRSLWDEHGGQVTGALKLVWGWLAEKIPAALTTMQTGVGAISEYLTPTFERIGEGLRLFLENLQPIIPIFQELGGEIQAAAPQFQDLARFVGYVALGIGGLLVGAIKILGEVLALVLPIAGAAFAGFFKATAESLGGLITFVTGVVDVFKGLFTNDLDLARQGAAKVIGGLVRAIMAPIEGLGVFLQATFGDTWRKVGDILQVAYEGMKGATLEWKDSIVGYFQGLWNHWQTGFEDAKTNLLETIRLTYESFTTKTETMVLGITGKFTGLWTSLETGIQTAKTTLITKVQDVVQSIKDTFTGDWGSTGQAIIQAIAGAFNDVKSLATAALGLGQKIIDSVIQGVQDNIGKFRENLYDIVRGIITELNPFASLGGGPSVANLALGFGSLGGTPPYNGATPGGEQQQIVYHIEGDTFYIENTTAESVGVFEEFLQRRKEERLNIQMGGF